jgi:hypothetical protein
MMQTVRVGKPTLFSKRGAAVYGSGAVATERVFWIAEPHCLDQTE